MRRQLSGFVEILQRLIDLLLGGVRHAAVDERECKVRLDFDCVREVVNGLLRLLAKQLSVAPIVG
jgi:hypothetical protein